MKRYLGILTRISRIDPDTRSTQPGDEYGIRAGIVFTRPVQIIYCVFHTLDKVLSELIDLGQFLDSRDGILNNHAVQADKLGPVEIISAEQVIGLAAQADRGKGRGIVDGFTSGDHLIELIHQGLFQVLGDLVPQRI